MRVIGNFSPLSEIPGSIELLENSLTYEGVQWRKIVECMGNFSKLMKRLKSVLKVHATDVIQSQCHGKVGE